LKQGGSKHFAELRENIIKKINGVWPVSKPWI